MVFKKVTFKLLVLSLFSSVALLGAMSSDSVVVMNMAQENSDDEGVGTVNMTDAIAQSNVKGVQFWLNRIKKVDEEILQSECINNGLIDAVRSGHVEIAKMLLEAGAIVDTRDKSGTPVLMRAVIKGHTPVVALLLKANANVEVCDVFSRTVLMHSAMLGNVEVTRLLLEAKARVDIQDDEGTTALMHAAEQGHVPVVALLLESNADIEACDYTGMTVLMREVGGLDKSEIIKLLLDAKANIETCTDDGVTPLMRAVRSGCKLIIELLLKEKAHIEACDIKGETALIKAAQQGCQEVVKVLLAYGASIVATDKKGNTALVWAQKNKCRAVVALLLDALKEQQKKSAFELSTIENAIQRMKHIHGTMNPLASFAKAMEVEEEEEKKEGAEAKGIQLTPTEVHFNAFRQRIESEFGKDILKNPIVQQCIERTRIAYQEGKIVLYRAEPGQLRVYGYFIEELYRLVHLYSKQHSFVFNRFFKEGAVEETIAQYVERVGNRFDRGQEYNVLLSANIPLFGNVNLSGSCTWDYFKHNKSIEEINVEELFVSVFNEYGFDMAYIKDLLSLDKDTAGYASLQQIVIPKEMVDDVAVLAKVGYCIPAQEKLSSVLEHYTSEEAVIDDAWQVRLLMNRTHGLNPESGIQFYTYTSEDVPHDALLHLKNQVKKITNEIFGDWLIQQLDKKQLGSGCMPRGLEHEPLETVLSYLGNEKFRQNVKQLQREDSVIREQRVNQAIRENNPESELSILRLKKEKGVEEDEEAKAMQSDAQLVGNGMCVVGDVAVAAGGAGIENVGVRSVIGIGGADKTMQDGWQREQHYESASVWKEYMCNNYMLGHGKLISSFMHDCARDKNQNAFIPQHYDNISIARVMTYNVHKWTDPNDQDSYQKILDIIKSINPDVLVLQEVVLSGDHDVEGDLKQMGYEYQVCMSMYTGWNFGNMIVSKYPFIQEPVKQVYAADRNAVEKRNFINTRIQLPNGKTVSVYGTHLDVWDETGTRRMNEAQELVEVAQKDMTVAAQSGQDQNVLLVADWNAVRAKDYQYLVKTKEGDVATVQAGESMTAWDVQTANFVHRVSRLELKSIPINALEHIEKNGFHDSFAQARMTAQNRCNQARTIVQSQLNRDIFEHQDNAVAHEECVYAQDNGAYVQAQDVGCQDIGAGSVDIVCNNSPRYTVWTGTVVDFMFCSPTWNLPIVGSYVYYNTASDHLPVIMDIELKPASWGFKPQPWLGRALKHMITDNNNK